MSEEHSHDHPQRIRYTVYLAERYWWGGRVTLQFIGVGSSQKEGELLISLEEGGLYSINYARVCYMIAEPLEGHAH